MAAEVEARWVRRFGRSGHRGSSSGTRGGAGAVADGEEGEAEVGVGLPQYLPIVAPTQNGKAAASLVSEPVRRVPGTAIGGDRRAVSAPATSAPDLSVLLAQVLLQFALDYEADARVSLTIAANTLRVLDETGVPIRELPRLTGVSKEGNSMALGFLARRECVVLEADPSARRGQRARLTPKGKASQEKYHRLLADTEERWRDRFGAANIARLRRGARCSRG